MKIGLIDVDSHNFPNLALMKISAYEKSKGNDVEWWFPLQEYDRVYQAKVFDKLYVMVYDKPHAVKELRQLQRWVNNKFIFRSCERFEDYGRLL